VLNSYVYSPHLQFSLKVLDLVPINLGDNPKDDMENLIQNDYPDFSSKGKPACASEDPELFYAQETETTALYIDEARAKAICKSCPYVIQCLEYAIKTSEIGIWGGTTEGQRTRLKKQMKATGQTFQEIAVSIKL
jgi:WhiB family redox-sensing transcriptional regulator